MHFFTYTTSHMPRAPELRIIPVPLADEIRPGDSLRQKLLPTLSRRLQAGDILIIKHKIISKAEGQLVDLNTLRPSASTRAWARRYNLDPRVTTLALRESKSILRRRRGVLITETHHGFICANTGVDVSNVDGGAHALLLPKDPDHSAAQLYRQIKKHLHLSIPIIITDSFGRPWREGLTEVAIGVAGMQALHDFRGRTDPCGYPLRVSIEAVADELACAAGLVCGKLARTPVCIVRGFRYRPGRGSARDLIRPPAIDLFR
jgi:coenzyme F420-0:L-glutamate ligase / coenzyme F420-1:gamma-L-glutamate ligase